MLKWRTQYTTVVVYGKGKYEHVCALWSSFIVKSFSTYFEYFIYLISIGELKVKRNVI